MGYIIITTHICNAYGFSIEKFLFCFYSIRIQVEWNRIESPFEIILNGISV